MEVVFETKCSQRRNLSVLTAVWKPKNNGISTCFFFHLRKLPDGEVPEKIKKSRGEISRGFLLGKFSS